MPTMFKVDCSFVAQACHVPPLYITLSSFWGEPPEPILWTRRANEGTWPVRCIGDKCHLLYVVGHQHGVGSSLDWRWQVGSQCSWKRVRRECHTLKCFQLAQF